jgi:hypothetical protein
MSKATDGLAPWDVYSIAGKARLRPEAVIRALHGNSYRSTLQRVIEAARELGIPLPGLADDNSTRPRAT